MSNEVPAGWYPDPNDAGSRRYWDGDKWLNIPEPGPSPIRSPRRKVSTRVTILIVAGALLIAAATGTGIFLKVAADNKESERIAFTEEADRLEEEVRATQAAEKQAAQDKEERDSRAASVTEIEASIKTMAEGHAADGIIDGPIIDVTCAPLGGGSTDDLDEKTTVFDCFVANVDNGDGTMSGFKYNATMNWTTGSFTYGLGAA